MNTKNKKIAIFGSAFNPPHRGHEDVINQALLAFDKVLLIPNYKHAFGKAMLPFDLRLQMTNTLANETKQPECVEVLDIERNMARRQNELGEQKPIYTFDVLCELEKHFPEAQLHFVIGPDNADPDTWQRFYKAQEITKRWQRWFAKERIAIRSTKIREGLSAGLLPSDDQCNPQVIALIGSYLKEQDFKKNNG